MRCQFDILHDICLSQYGQFPKIDLKLILLHCSGNDLNHSNKHAS